MKAAKIYVLMVLLSGCLLVASAENSIFEAPVTQANRETLNAVCTRIAANPVVRGSFSQTKHLSRLKKDFSAAGTFLFSTSDGVLWNVEKPYPSSMIMTRERLVQTTKGGKTSVLDGSGSTVFKRFADTLQAVFAGRLIVLEQDFQLYFAGTASQWRVGLVPREETVKALIQSLEISGDEYIRTLKLVEAGGDTTLYSFHDSASSAGLAANERAAFASAGMP